MYARTWRAKRCLPRRTIRNVGATSRPHNEYLSRAFPDEYIGARCVRRTRHHSFLAYLFPPSTRCSTLSRTTSAFCVIHFFACSTEHAFLAFDSSRLTPLWVHALRRFFFCLFPCSQNASPFCSASVFCY